jgi:DNA-binding NarL/FixJ family response regulator
MAGETLRLLVADDHPLFRKGLRTLLGSVSDFTLVGEAETGADAVEKSLALQPDVVLMDLQMPGGSGIDAIREIVAASPTTNILVVTLFEDDDSVFAALRAGARGYVLKDTDEDEMIRAIRAVGNGEAIFSPAVAKRVLAYFAVSRREAPQLFPTLTEREREILRLLAQGKSNPAIAAELFLSSKTVANHVSNIFGKLQVADRAEAIIRARDAGLR